MIERKKTESSPISISGSAITTFVLLQRPKFLNIPYFAMGHSSASREEFREYPLFEKRLSISSRCLAWLKQHNTNDAITVVETRHVHELKTAVYMELLAFKDRKLADEFTKHFQKYDIERTKEQLQQKTATLEAKLAERTARHVYDLSGLPQDQRYHLAKQYADICADIKEYQRELDDLLISEKLIKRLGQLHDIMKVS